MGWSHYEYSGSHGGIERKVNVVVESYVFLLGRVMGEKEEELAEVH